MKKKKEKERERQRKRVLYIYNFNKNTVYIFIVRFSTNPLEKFQAWGIPLVEACQGWGGFQVWKNCEMIELAIGFRSVRAPVASKFR